MKHLKQALRIALPLALLCQGCQHIRRDNLTPQITLPAVIQLELDPSKGIPQYSLSLLNHESRSSFRGYVSDPAPTTETPTVDQKPVWSIGDAQIAAIEGAGDQVTVKAKKEGETTLTLTVNEVVEGVLQRKTITTKVIVGKSAK